MSQANIPTDAPPSSVQGFSWARFWTWKLALLLVIAGIYLIFESKWFQPKPMRDLAAEALLDLEQRQFRKLSGDLGKLVNDPDYKPIATQSVAILGNEAPGFQLRDTDDKPWSLEEALKKGPVVVVFYYGYHCNHCVSQLFGLHKDIEKFKELGVSVVAMSSDPSELTRERYLKYGPFSFPVLSDPDNKVAQKYGTYVPSPNPGEDGDLAHGTFLVNQQGKVIWANTGPEPFTENRTLLVELHRSLKNQ